MFKRRALRVGMVAGLYAMAASGQIMERRLQTTSQVSQIRPLLDASGEPMGGSFREPAEGREYGTVSLTQLQHPLTSESKRMLSEAEQLLKDGKRDRAFRILETAAADRAASPYAYTMLGAEHLRMGRVEEALRELETAAALLPGLTANHYNLAIALVKLGRDAEALKEAQMALQLDPGRSDTRYVMGVALLRMGRKEEAQFHLKKAAAEIPAASALLSQFPGR